MHKKLMWMDTRICSDKAHIQAGNIRVYVMTTQKGNAARYSARDLNEFTHLAGKFNKGPQVFWDYVLVFDNTPKKLILKSIVLLNVAAT